MTVRKLTHFDAETVASLETLCFPLPWSLKAVKTELKNPIALYLGAFIEGKLAGYAGIHMILDEGYITNIATDPEMRRRGVADKLLGGLMEAAARRELRFVTLEVRESNIPAQSLYKKHGFTAVGKREGYYDNPKEDAVIMTNEHISL